MTTKIIKSKSNTVYKISETMRESVERIHSKYEDIQIIELDELIQLSESLLSKEKQPYNTKSELNLKNSIGDNYYVLEEFFYEVYQTIEDTLIEITSFLTKEETDLLMNNLISENYSNKNFDMLKNVLSEATLQRVGIKDLENLKIKQLFNVHGVPIENLKTSRYIDLAINIINTMIDELIENKKSLMSVLYIQ